ncbi:MAG: DsbA family protein [Candidatus Micrarchaeia archaeon]
MDKKRKEPQIVIRPIGKLGGLDNIHIALIVLVAILVTLLAIISYSKPTLIINQTNSTSCSGYCANEINMSKPIHNVGEVLNYTEKVLASYNFINANTSLGVYLPFYSNITSVKASYAPSSKEWFVNVPIIDPITNKTFYASFVIYDSNLTLARAYLQTVSPSRILNYQVVYPGVIDMPGKFACSPEQPVKLFWFIDPYAPGSIYSLEYITKLEQEFGGNINVSVKVLFGAYTSLIASRYGEANAEWLGKYILCASQQGNFSNFITNLNSLYANNYMSNQTLYTIAKFSKLNMNALSACMLNSTTLINRQTLLAEYYNITATPFVVVNCKYLTLPETASNGICFTNSTLCK